MLRPDQHHHPPSVTSIGQQAFYGCSGLTSIAIPNSITSIPDYAFSACTGLTSITIPNSVTSIGTSAFQSCTGLTSITIPTSVTSIGTNAFYNCTGLTSVTIPNSIGSDAFTGCSNLKSVTVPSSVTSIHPLAFNGCTKLLSLVVDPVNPNYSSLNGVLFDKLNTSLLLYPNGKSGEYIIPSSVTSIGTSAFQSCTSLTSVTIPNSVASIGNFAFSGCTSLGRVTISSSVTSIGSFAFSGCTVLSSCYIMGNAPGLGTSVFNSTQATVYYLNGTLGWKATFGGLVTVALVLPSIIVPPISLSVGTGESAAFNVIAQTTFPLTLSYQWQRNGIAIPSATATSLVLNNIQAANAGTYTVVVANDVGSVASSSTLTLAQGGLYTQVQYDAALQQGMTAGLQTGMSAGRSQVLDYPNTYGLYSLKQVQALNVGVPLLAKDPVSGKFKLTIGVKKSIDLITYGAFPIPTGAASLNANGEMEFQFSSPDKAAFFRLDSH